MEASPEICGAVDQSNADEFVRPAVYARRKISRAAVQRTVVAHLRHAHVGACEPLAGCAGGRGAIHSRAEEAAPHRPVQERDRLDLGPRSARCRGQVGPGLLGVLCSLRPRRITVCHHYHGAKGWEKPHLRLWKTDTGAIAAQLRPFEQTGCEKIQDLLWSPDGQYLLATTKADSFFTSEGISVWDVKTGRHRGDFSGCPTNVNGIALLPDGSELVAGCIDGTIRFWDFAGAMKQICDFENSLRPLGRSARDKENTSPSK